MADEALLAALKAGAAIRYFFLSGGVTVHDPSGEPSKTLTCDIQTFLDLRERGVIVQSATNLTGYPYYADGSRSDEYRIV